MNTRVLLMTTSIAMLWAGAASAQEYNGTTGAAPVATTVLGSSSTSTSGDSTVAPYVNVTTTVQNQVAALVSTSPPTSILTTVNGIPYSGNLTVSGSAGQPQTVTSTLTNTYNGGTPPVLLTSVPAVGAPVNVGSPAITSIYVGGYVNAEGQSDYASTLSSSGPVVNNAVVATENSVTSTTSGVSFEQRVGTATYAPATGLVTVALPAAPTSKTSITSSGLVTTGTVAAATVTATTVNGTTVNAGVLNANVGGLVGALGINAGNGRIGAVSNGVLASDAVNKGQLDAAVNGLQGQINSLNELVHDNKDYSDAGSAIAIALSGGAFLPNKTWNLTANVGGYGGEEAIAAQVGFLVSESVALNAGIATSFSGHGSVGWRGGVTFGF